MDWFKLTAPCGMDCFNCQAYEKNISPEMQKMFAARLGKPEGEIGCKGCRQEGTCLLLPSCATLECVKSKNVDFCYQCDSFPCEKLAPCAQGAEKYPHNFKLFNLCRIQKVGLQAWAENEANEIRKKYYQGEFAIGTGPQLR